MKTAAIFHDLFDYHYALYRRVWDSIMQLSDEQFVQEIDYSHGSVRNQMVHVAVTDKRWLMGLQGNPDARAFTLDPADYPTRQSARALWDSTAKEVTAYVTALEDEDLAQTPMGMGGPAWQVLAHLVNHGTDHRAQILRALHDLGAPTFDQDMVSHLWAP